jgi:hypothetical protein
MSEPSLTPDIFDELTKLVENIPFVDGQLTSGNIDTKHPVGETEATEILPSLGIQGDAVSFRDIVTMITKLLRRTYWKALMDQSRLIQLRGIVSTYPIEYLLFDYCLAALDKDHMNAKLYLDHATNILGLPPSFHKLLSLIVRQPFTSNKDVRVFLAQFASAIEPPSAEGHAFNKYGKEFKKRYNVYKKALKNHR